MIFSLVSFINISFGEDICFEEACDNSFSIDANYAAFFPLNSTVKRIYGSALPQFTVGGNWQWNECWGLWLDGSYIFGNGHSMGCGRSSTHLNLVPLSIGINYFCPVCDSIRLYLGLGGCYSFLRTTDHSPYVHKKTSANNGGAMIKTGVVYDYCKGFLLHGFFNYMYQKMNFPKTKSDPFVYRNDVDLSALQLGIGIGIDF